MYLIVGLGNPEADYANTRHNLGFCVVNQLAQKYGMELNRKKFNSEYEIGMIEGEKVLLVKPQTFMNASGEAVVQFVNFYKIELDKILIVYDDMDIEPGKIRIRKSGLPGSHNGMKSIVHFLNSENFPRVRIGIGRPSDEQDRIEYVIGAIPEEDKEKLEQGVELAKNAIIEILQDGIDSAMNHYN